MSEPSHSSVGTKTAWRVALVVVVRPLLWAVALATVFRLARRGWWRRVPFLPLPDEAYWRFRMETAYGGDGADAALSTPDVLAYLRWCQRMRVRRG